MSPMTRNHCFWLAVALAAGTALAQAQVADPKACASPSTPNQTLSDKLGQSNGVICPPDVDPDIKAPTPNAGKMPVIPPPGSPGGDPSVEPK
jgi:hypothetical protein